MHLLVIEIKKLNHGFIKLADGVRKFIKNKGNSLNERWKLYVEAVEKHILWRVQPWIWHSMVLERVGLEFYDDFGVERYQTKKFISIVERIEDELGDHECGNKRIQERMTLELLDAFKRKFCNQGI